MEKKEFEEKWDEIEDTQKIVRLRDETEFYTDNYTISAGSDGIEKVSFELEDNEIGSCRLSVITHLV